MIGASVGSYRVQREIGQGGMGVVYVAEHPLIGRKAAVKVLRPDFCRNQEVVNRFFNEARAAALIKHPGLVDVFDFGYDADGSAYLVMEFLEGESLGARLEREKKLPQELIIEIGRQTAAALAAAHQQGIIHRDLKPDNLFLVPDSELGLRVKVLDFGIAKLTIDDGNIRQTQTGVVMGTPLYMSPEQSGGAGHVDPRADIYSLGCILFEMACGRPPFLKEGMGETIAAHIYEPPPSPRSIEPSVSPGLEAVILRALEKKPDKRPPTMMALRQELDNVPRTDVRLQAHPPTVTAMPATDVVPASEDVVPRKSKTPLFIVAGAVVAAGVLALTVTKKDKPAPPPPAPVIAPVVVAPKPPEPKPIEKITLKIESEPPGADVFRAADGVLVGVTPFSEKREPSSGKAVFLIRKSGFKDGRVELTADQDGAQLVKLERPHASPKKPADVKKTRVHDGAYDPYGEK